MPDKSVSRLVEEANREGAIPQDVAGADRCDPKL
jgi:hypothetical protein